MNTDKCYKKQDELIPIYQPKHSRILWRASWLFLGTAAYATYQQHYDLAVAPMGIFLTSINYWRHPTYCPRRTADIICVWLATGYTLTRALTAQHSIIFYIGYAIAFTCYPISNMYLKQGNHYHSAILHALMHLFSNISNIILFSGSIDDTYEVAKLYLFGGKI